MTTDLVGLLDAVLPIARRAGQAIRDVADEPLDARDKADGSPVTRADLASHNCLRDGLAELAPDIPLMSEEGDLDHPPGGGGERFWCVDPLDGTKEFINGLEDYTVNVAVVDDGLAVLGVIYLPARRMTYYAAAGAGAFRQADGAEPEPIAAADRNRPEVAVVSRSHLSEDTEAFLEQLGVRDVVRRGSSAKICAVADGSADLYPRFGPTWLWDTAAGTAVARAAGCRVVGLDGEDLTHTPAEGMKRPGFLVLPAASAAWTLDRYRRLRPGA